MGEKKRELAGALFVSLAILAQSGSLVLLKLAAISGAGVDRYLSIWYVSSLLALGVQALVWQQALKRLPLSFAYPMMSVVFVIIPGASYLLFDETIAALQILGTGLIISGTVLIARTEHR